MQTATVIVGLQSVRSPHHALLPDLECSSETLSHWLPLRDLARRVANFSPPPYSPPTDLVDLAASLMSDDEEQIARLGEFWGARDNNAFPFTQYCIFGHFTALYVMAWSMATDAKLHEATNLLQAANRLLRLDDHDLLDHTSWPFSSWDVMANIYALSNGREFLPRWSRAVPSRVVRDKLPLVWPALAPELWPLPYYRSSASSGMPILQEQYREKKRLVVWWTTKHPGPFVDIVTILEEFVSDRFDVHVSSNAVSEYCSYPIYRERFCAKDEYFSEGVMRRSVVLTQKSQRECGEDRGQWCGLRELHENFDRVVDEFDRGFRDQVKPANADLLICGHPLYWCRLFERVDTPIIGVWEMSHHFAVPEPLQEHWHQQFLEMFQQPQNLLIAFCAFHGFQATWLLGFNVPYFPPIALAVAMEARYAPEHSNKVLLSVFNTPYEIPLLQRLAESLPDFPLRLVAWPRDLDCGTDCSKSDLARFRAVILCAYDTGTLKLAEFYAMQVPIFVHGAGFWRTTMRWAKASANEAGSNATFVGRVVEPPQHMGGDAWATIVNEETERIRWEVPWHLKASTSHDYDGSAAAEKLPFAPYTSSRAELHPGSAAFWSQLTDWNLLPHIIQYDSAGQLLAQLSTTSLDELQAVSRRMASHHARLQTALVNFWRALVVSMVEHQDASTWRGAR